MIVRYMFFCVVAVLPISLAAESAQDVKLQKDVRVGDTVRFASCGNGDTVLWLRMRLPLFIVMSGQPKQVSSPRFSFVNTSHGYDMYVSDVTIADDGLPYSCLNDGIFHDTLLNVVVPPQNATIATNASEIREGDVVTLSCAVSGANPPPNVTWSVSRAPVSGDAGARDVRVAALVETARQVADTKFGQMSSMVTFVAGRSHHGANITCEASNQAGSLRTAFPLTVLYKPVVSFSSSSVTAAEGDSLVLSCLIDANPPVAAGDIWWTRRDQDTVLEVNKSQCIGEGRGHNLTINRIKRTGAGVYVCAAKNTVGESSNSVDVLVQYVGDLSLVGSEGAEVSGRVVSVREGAVGQSVTCHVQSFPPARIRWYRGSNDSVLIARGPVLNIQPAVTRAHAGPYLCIAAVTMTPIGQPARELTEAQHAVIRVLHKPGPATLTVPKKAPIVGQNTTLTCSANDPGVPEAKFKWFLSAVDGVVHEGAQYVINNVQLNHIGLYSCQAINDLGAGNAASEYLDVTEPPSWLGLTAGSSLPKVIDRVPDDIRCSVRGRPKPTISWLKDGVEVTATSALYTVKHLEKAVGENSWNVTSVLSWQGRSRSANKAAQQQADENGNYTCVVKQTGQLFLTSLFVLNVPHVPIIQYPMLTSARVAVAVGRTAKLQCVVRSNPAAGITWTVGNGQTVYPGGQLTISTRTTTNTLFESTLQIEHVTAADLGAYTCTASNVKGSASVVIVLSELGVPELPSQVTVSKIGWQTVMVNWVAGFDGGYRQEFIVEYKMTSADQQHQQLSRQEVSNTSVELTGLYPSTLYALCVKARNKLGTGGCSRTVNFTTKELHVPSPAVVTFNSQTGRLTFSLPGMGFCARIDVLDKSNQWVTSETCAPVVGGALKLRASGLVRAVRVAFCSVDKPSVCSNFTTALGGTSPAVTDVPMQVIVIVGGVCGVIVVVLLIVLVILLCKRRDLQRKYEQTRGSSAVCSAASSSSQHHTQLVDVGNMNVGDSNVQLNAEYSRTGTTSLTFFPNNNEYAGWPVIKGGGGGGGGMDLRENNYVSPAGSSRGSSGSDEPPTTLALLPHSTDSGYGESLPDHCERYYKDRLSLGLYRDRCVQSPSFGNSTANSSGEHSLYSTVSRPKRVIHEVVV